MNDKNRQRHIAYEVLVILGQLALLTYITRLWPILLLVILGIFVAALRLLFLSSQKVEPVRPPFCVSSNVSRISVGVCAGSIVSIVLLTASCVSGGKL